MKYQTQNYEPKQNISIPAGNYEFIVANAEEKESKAGNPMINLEMLISAPGRETPVKVYDCLVFTDAALFKVEQFCKATGLDDKFKIDDNGNTDVDLSDFDCVNRQGTARFENDAVSGYLRVRYYINANRNSGYQASPSTPRQQAPRQQAATPPTMSKRLAPVPPTVPFKEPSPAPTATTPDDSFDPDDIPF